METRVQEERVKHSTRAILAAAGVAAAVAVAGPVGAGTAQKGKDQSKLSIESSVNPVTYQRSTVISGRLTGQDHAGQTVELEENPYPFTDNHFDNVAATTTRNDGTYGGPGVAGFTRTPLVNTQYRARAKTSPPTESSVLTELVRVRVSLGLSDSTPRRGARVRFSGSVRPEHDGKTARIQRRQRDGDWTTVATTTLADVPGEERSSYNRRVRVRRDGTYRVRVSPGDGDHATGTSRRRRIDVH
jgi:hypothetical protein